MEFEEIKYDKKVYPGEYLLHIPSQQIVVCGAYKKSEGKIKAMAAGRLMEDAVSNFKKIKLQSRRDRKAHRKCGGCKR